MDHNLIFTLVILFSNLFRFYVIYEFLDLFFQQEKVNRVTLYYLGFFWIIDSALAIYYDWYTDIKMIFNYIIILVVVMFVNESTRLKLSALALVPTVNIICDDLVNRLLLLWNVEHIETIGLSISSLAFFIVVLFIKKCFNLKEGEIFTGMEFLSLVVITIISVYISATVLDKCEDEIAIILGSFSMLLLNGIVYFLLEHISTLRKNQYDVSLLEQQNEAYEKQIQLLIDSDEQIKSLRHDMKNHLIVLGEMARKEQCVDLVEYLNEIGTSVYEKEKFISTGNPAFDSLINIKLRTAQVKYNADIKADIQIPQDINIKNSDFNIIVGNLLDNSLNALEKCKENKWISFDIHFSKSVLFLSLANSYNGELNVRDGKILTTKEKQHEHGIGLHNVKTVVEKYNGVLEISHTDHTFTVDMMIYLS